VTGKLIPSRAGRPAATDLRRWDRPSTLHRWLGWAAAVVLLSAALIVPALAEAAKPYGVAAAVFALQSLDSFLVAGGEGTGQWLSGAIVAAALAIAYGSSLYRTVLTRGRLGAATFPLDQAGRLLS
jgi:hypothetical protein